MAGAAQAFSCDPPAQRACCGRVEFMDMGTSKPLQDLLAQNLQFIPGGISSANRIIDPPIAFKRAQGAYLWDIEGRRYIDYHAAFAPYFLGHNFAPVNQAAADILGQGESLFGAGPSQLEGELARLLCTKVGGAV